MPSEDQRICNEFGGKLPEPRDEGENDFLDSLNTEMFNLGMKYKQEEAQWLWETDGSTVAWFKWTVWKSGNSEPDGYETENCVVSMNKPAAAVRGDNKGVWGDYPCNSDTTQERKLICQKLKGDFYFCF